MSERRKDPREKKCGICGKDLYAGEDWAYKRRPGRGDKTTWFCSYKCMRAYDAKHGQKKRPEGLPADLNATAPKEPVSRAVLAKALAEEIKRGGSVITYMKAEGYKNPWEAYNAVRHYCETNMPELAMVLKPLKELPKGPQQKTGRPRKPRPVVERVDLVPEVDPGKNVPTLEELREIAEMPEPDPEPVQCIAHVTDAEIEEVMKNMRQRHDNLIVPGAQEAEEPEDPEKPKVDPTIAMKELGEALHKFTNSIFTKDKVLRIVDEAALACMQEKSVRWGGTNEQQEMLHDTKLNAEGVGVMKLRRKIREKLEADDDE